MPLEGYVVCLALVCMYTVGFVYETQDKECRQGREGGGSDFGRMVTSKQRPRGVPWVRSPYNHRCPNPALIGLWS